MNQDIISRLKEVMREKQLSQSQLAEDLGLTQGTLSLYLSGKNSPKKFMIVAMGYAMGINPDWLLTGQGDTYINKEENIPENGKFLFVNRKIKELKTTISTDLKFIESINDAPEATLYLNAIKSDTDQILNFLNSKQNG